MEVPGRVTRNLPRGETQPDESSYLGVFCFSFTPRKSLSVLRWLYTLRCIDIFIKMTKLHQYFHYKKMLFILAVCPLRWIHQPDTLFSIQHWCGLQDQTVRSKQGWKAVLLLLCMTQLIVKNIVLWRLDPDWTLFLWPDGSGEALAHLPSLKPDICDHFSPSCWPRY